MDIDKNIDVYLKYKEILDKYFKKNEIGIWIGGFLIMNYIFEYGNNIEKFEKYVKKYKDLKEELKEIK